MGVKLITQDVDTILYKILNASSELKAMISGRIYKDGFRPKNSGKLDISIKTIAITQEQPQIAICNVNCHVQDLKQTIDGQVEYVPNSATMKSIADKISQVISGALTDPLYKDFSVRIEDQRTFNNQDSEVKEHFQNVRVELIIPNTI